MECNATEIRGVLVPICHTSGNVRTDHLQDGTVKNLALAINGWVVRSGACFSDLHTSTKAENQSDVKFLPWSVWTSRGHTKVTMKCLRNALAQHFVVHHDKDA